MRSHLLSRAVISFWKWDDIQSKSGFKKKEKVEIYKRIHCNISKQEGNENVNAKETFDNVTLKIKIRKIPELQDNWFVTYKDENYKITMIEDSIYEWTQIITCKKINE